MIKFLELENNTSVNISDVSKINLIGMDDGKWCIEIIHISNKYTTYSQPMTKSVAQTKYANIMSLLKKNDLTLN